MHGVRDTLGDGGVMDTLETLVKVEKAFEAPTPATLESAIREHIVFDHLGGEWKDDGDDFVKCASELLAHGFTAQQAYDFLCGVYSTVAGEFGC